MNEVIRAGLSWAPCQPKRTDSVRMVVQGEHHTANNDTSKESLQAREEGV